MVLFDTNGDQITTDQSPVSLVITGSASLSSVTATFDTATQSYVATATNGTEEIVTVSAEVA